MKETKIYTDFKENDIQEYLNIVFRLINEGKRKLRITKDNKIRIKNKKFIRKYKIKEKQIDNIIRGITINDFCYAADEKDSNFSDERLYIFCKQEELEHYGYIEKIDIYIKLKKDKLIDGTELILYISFHERERPINYLFRDKS